MPAHKGNKYAVGNKGGGRIDGVYNPKYHPKKAYELFCLLDMTNAKVAKIFEVSESCIEKWCREHKEFREACRAGRDDSDVAVSFRKSARGYTKRTEKVFVDKDCDCPQCQGKGKLQDPKDKRRRIPCGTCEGSGKGRVIRVQTRTYFPPDIAAGKFWLMNRQGWKSTKSMEWNGKLETDDGDTINVEDLSPETQEMVMRDLEKAAAKENEKAAKRNRSKSGETKEEV